MSLISFTPLADGVTAVNAAATNTPLSTIYNDYNGNVTDANISASAAIAASKLALPTAGSAAASVLTDQPTANTTYVDLATTGPAVTVTIGANGFALVIISALMNNNGQFNSYMSFAVSGANTVAAADVNCLTYGSWVANSFHGASRVVFLTGLAAGSTTFTAKYRANGSTANFSNRFISVVPF